jgi:hypothetical protein
MKFDGKRLNGEGATIYTFSLGAQELRLLSDVVSDFYRKLPKGILALSTARSRIKNINREFTLQVRADKIKN